MPNPIDVTFELVTPAYAGGADPAVPDCLRPPVLKSMLRFWWRTRLATQKPESLWRGEAQIFGSTTYVVPGDPARKTRGGQSLRCVPEGDWGSLHPEAPALLSTAQKYLGYGRALDEETDVALPRIKAGQRSAAALSLIPQRKANDSYIRHLYESLWLMSAFGGIGGRNRRGWGSLRVRCSFPEDLPDPHANIAGAKDSLEQGLRAVFPNGVAGLSKSLPPFTAFSKHCLIALGPARDGWEAALDAAGRALLDYRRLLGAGTKTSGKGPDNQWRRAWFNWLEQPSQLGPDDTGPPSADDCLPLGSAFGLPHNAYFRDEKTLGVGVGEDLSGRRGSPLFISVLGDGQQFRPVVLFLPATFLPSDRKAHVRLEAGRAFPLRSPIWDGVTEFYRGSNAVRWRGLFSMAGWQEVTW